MYRKTTLPQSLYSFFKKHINSLILFFSFLLFTYQLDLTWFNSHMSRDLMRAMEWAHLNLKDWLGPEMGWDYKRLPGPFYYILMAPLIWLASVEAIIFYKIVLLFGGLILLTREMSRLFEKRLVSTFLLLFCLVPLHFLTSRNIWNPSLIVLCNILQLTFFLKYFRTQKNIWIWASFLTAGLAVQIHFSTLNAFAAFALAILLTTFRKKRSDFYLQLILLCGLSAFLFIWYRSSQTEIVDQYVYLYYSSLSHFWPQRLLELLGSLSFAGYSQPGDYSVDSLFVKFSEHFDVYNYSFWHALFVGLNVIYGGVFVTGFLCLLKKAVKLKNQLDLFLVIYVCIFICSTLMFNKFPHIPYRYLLSIYPIQFFIMAYGIYSIRKSFVKLLLPIAALSFLMYAHYDFKNLKFQEITGRISHRFDDNLELPLRNKREVYDFIMANSTFMMDPFEEIHGRLPHKMRNKEFDWPHTSPYFSLFEIYHKRPFLFDPEVIAIKPARAWYFYFKSSAEIKNNLGANPIVFAGLSTAHLPQDLIMTYLDKDGAVIKRLEWQNTNMILPFAFFDNFQNLQSIQLEFKMDAKANPFFNVIADFENTERWAPSSFTEQKLLLDGNFLEPHKLFDGLKPAPQQSVYKLPPTEKFIYNAILKLRVNPELFNNESKRNYFRLDLFGTDFEPHQEELGF